MSAQDTISYARSVAAPRLAGWPSRKWLFIGAVVAVVVWLALVPLAFLLWQGVTVPAAGNVPVAFTLGHYAAAFTDSRSGRCCATPSCSRPARPASRSSPARLSLG